jgi:hypothetical protein
MMKKQKAEEKGETIKSAAKRLTFAVNSGRVVFYLDGAEAFFFERNDFLELTNRPFMVECLFQEEMTPSLDLETTAKVSRLSKKGLPFDTIAKILEMDELKLKSGFREGLKKYDTQLIFREEARQAEILGERDFVKTYQVINMIRQEGEMFIKLSEIKQAMKFNQLDGFIKAQNIDSKDFEDFLKSNEKYLAMVK